MDPESGAHERAARIGVLAHRRRWLDRALLTAVALGTLALAAIPPPWRADPSPYPDALEYALSARALAHGDGYRIPALNGRYRPHYPFGFPALLVPWYWLPGAGLAAGLYGVALFAVATATGVYVLGRRTGGLAGALAGAATVALSAKFLDWSHRVMSETATAALVAGVALALARHATAPSDRARERWAVTLGMLCGLGLVTRFPNAVLPVAVGVALVLDPRVRTRLGRTAMLVALGPALAIVARFVSVRRFTPPSCRRAPGKYWTPAGRWARRVPERSLPALAAPRRGPRPCSTAPAPTGSTGAIPAYN